MPVMVNRLTPANFDRVVHSQPYTLVRIDRPRRFSFHDGVVEYFVAAYPRRFGFGTVHRQELADSAWLDQAFVSAVGRVRGGVQDGYYLFEHGVVVGHHRGQVRAGVTYGDPRELAAQRERVTQLAFAGRRVDDATLEVARAITVYFDDIVRRKEGAEATSQDHRYVREERERTAPPSRPPPPPPNDPYQVLGIARSATDDEVKKAYREGLKMNHPDKVAHLSTALQKFAETQTLAIKDAYEQIRAERE
ncbi:MAG: J domain-containing protein [Myxococcota bacterium]